MAAHSLESDAAGIIDEQTALLLSPQQTAAVSSRKDAPRNPTPLPKMQLAVALIMMLCEPLASTSIYPYINQHIGELDITNGDERKVGYYAGLIQSIFFAAEALTVFQWSRLSDRIGRKPVILIGLVGTMLSILLFGLSRSYWTLVVSRSLVGLLNGNVGVMKSFMGDLTDSTNRAQGFATLPIVWAVGCSVGPLIGGSLAKPSERFPGVFGGQFWVEYPYFLPCLTIACFTFVAIIISMVLLEETLKSKKVKTDTRSYGTIEEASSSALTDSPTRTKEEPVPLNELFIFPIIISVSNYILLAFLDIAFYALFPLFLAMPIHIGGIGLEPAQIGYIMGVFGAMSGTLQFLFFAPLVRLLSERRVFLNGVASFFVIFGLMPVINWIARRDGELSGVIWVLIAIVLITAVAMDMAFGAVFIFITASAPNKRSLGATNGLSQTGVSITRAIGPALTTSMFSLSVEKNILGGYAVYVGLIAMALVATFVGSMLPAKVWEKDHEEE